MVYKGAVVRRAEDDEDNAAFVDRNDTAVRIGKI